MKSNNFKNNAEQLSNRSWHLILFTFALSLLAFFSGCDQTFQPIQDNYNAPFSMFGYLDASADTQWVRVAPIRRQISMSAKDIPNMKITIKDPKNGDTTVMNDSLFLYPDGFNVLNAWGITDMLKPNQTVLFKAERTDGAKSQINITFPPDFPTPRLEIDSVAYHAILYIEGVEDLVTVQVRTQAQITSKSAGWNYTDVFWTPQRRIVEWKNNGYKVLMTPGDMYNVKHQIPQPPRDDLEIEYLHHQVFTASGGPDWNENLSDLEDIRYSLPEVISNVQNGTGYMFGIVSKSVPFKSCFDEWGEYVSCPAEAPLH